MASKYLSEGSAVVVAGPDRIGRDLGDRIRPLVVPK
jgi:hypothetical protein